MNITNIIVGQRIKSLRLELGESMEKFGERFNTSKGTINNWEKGRNLPNKQNLLKLSQLAKTTVKDFMFSVPQNTKDNVFNEVLNAKILDEEERKYIKEHFSENSLSDFENNSVYWEVHMEALSDDYKVKKFIETHTNTEILDYISNNLYDNFLESLTILNSALYEHNLKERLDTEDDKQRFVGLILKIDMYKKALSIQFELLEEKTPEIKRKP